MNLVLSEKTNGVLKLAFNRPEKKNAITLAMYLEMTAQLRAASADPAVRVVLFHGNEQGFTAGNDLADFLSSPIEDNSPVPKFLRTVIEFDKPMVAVVNGLAIGIGTTLLLHCDLVYCGTDAKFSLPFINLGVVPEAGSSVLLPRLAGYHKAAELLLLGEPFGPDTAREIGLANAVVAPADLMATAMAAAAKLAAKPPAAMRQARRLLKEGARKAVDEANAAEMKAFMEALRGPEAKEAITAFFEKRKPDFSRFS